MPKNPVAASAFLGLLEKGWSVTAAARQADLDRRTVYRWRARDRKFAENWDHAVETATDALEDEVRRRAVEGGTKVTAKKGEVVTVTQASDRLLIALLAARRPERFRPMRRARQDTAQQDIANAAQQEADDSARKRLQRKLDRLARALGARQGDAAAD